MTEALRNLTIKSFHEGLTKKEFKALEITQGYFGYIEDKDKEINAYLTLLEDDAIKQAEATDIKIAKGEDVNPLSGVPLALKDNILIEGHRTTAASKTLETYVASYDASVAKKLRGAGSVFLGKTNLDEFAMGASTENSAFQATKNPHDTARVAGGSSGGSAAAVAAHMALAALGSDTGGSIRQPAAFCGVVGLRPTYGAVSRHGLIAMASSLDQIGPITKTVEDAALLFRAIAGNDAYDATSNTHEYGEELINPNFEKVKQLVVGLPEEYFTNDLSGEVKTQIDVAVEKLKSLGVNFRRINLPHTKYAISTYYIVVPAEVSANLARFDGMRYERGSSAASLTEFYKETRGKGFGPETKRRVILGTFVLSSGYHDAYYAKAQKVRTLIKQDFMESFKDVDVILTPTTPTPAFKIGEKTENPLDMYLADVFVTPASLAGLPAVSIPVTTNRLLPPTHLPIGFQLIGKPFHESDLLGLGQFYEKI